MLFLKASPFFITSTTLMGSLAWLTSTSLNSSVTTLVGAGTTAVLGYISITQMLDKRRQERRRLDLEDEVTRIRAIDDAHRQTLSGQLDEVNANHEKMRKSLHEISQQATVHANEAAALRLELRQSEANFISISNQLATANQRIYQLTMNVTDHNARVETKLDIIATDQKDQATEKKEI